MRRAQENRLMRVRRRQRSRNTIPSSVRTLSPRFETLEERAVLSVTMTGQEQLLLELINRARSDPAGEAALFGIGLNDGLAPGAISSSPKQPLAPHQALINAAGAHSQDMLDNDYFSHTNLSGQSPSARATAAGYPSTFVGENIAWGGSTGPINQNAHVYARHESLFHSPGHRQNMLSTSYRELGTGVRYGVYQGYNASMVTEKFGSRGGVLFITGVTYSDTIVDDDFYTIGEGAANVSITAVHNTTNAIYSTVSGASGGFTLQVPGGTYTVSASGGGLSDPITVSNVVVGSQNVKVDFDTSTSPSPDPDPPAPSTVQIIDNGTSGYSTSGSWVNYVGMGRGNRIDFSAPGSGADTARWTFNVSPGRYRVSATWTAHPNRASNAPYTLRDGSTEITTVAINQRSAPNDFNDAGSAWEDLGGPHNVQGNTLVVELSDAGNGYTMADAIRIERLGDVVIEPEIEVLDGSTDISNGGTVDFGSTQPNTSVDKQLTVRNTGTGNLTLTPLNAGSLPPGYSIVSNFASTNLAPNESTTFTLRLQSASESTFTGSISIANNDDDENPFDLSLTGIVASGPTVQIIDNGTNGYSTSGSWVNYVGMGRGNRIDFSAPGSGADTARWTFNVSPGRYRVSATWTAHPNRANNAPYTLRDGSTEITTVAINQRSAPNDFNDAGSAWEDLGGPHNVQGNTLVVELSDAGNGYTMADAIRIERIGDVVIEPEIEVLDGSTDISDGGTVDFGSTQPNTSVDKQLTVRNTGTGNLTLTPLNAGSLPPGYSIVSNFASTNLAPNESTTFTLRLQSASESTFTGSISIANNDDDENPFDLSLTGIVASGPSVQIIDNGTNGYSTSGSWVHYVGLGRGNRIDFSAPGSGADTARWTFNVSPGRYRVSATWTAHPNRANNAPYTLRDGSTDIATIAINQRLAPNDFNDDGSAWEDLGGPHNVQGNTLVVELSDAGNGYTMADAIRIERIGDIVP